MSKNSSFKNHQLLTENWRQFLREAGELPVLDDDELGGPDTPDELDTTASLDPGLDGAVTRGDVRTPGTQRAAGQAAAGSGVTDQERAVLQTMYNRLTGAAAASNIATGPILLLVQRLVKMLDTEIANKSK